MTYRDEREESRRAEDPLVEACEETLILVLYTMSRDLELPLLEN